MWWGMFQDQIYHLAMRMFVNPALVDLFGGDYTGVSLSEEKAQDGKWRAEIFRQVYESLSPAFCIFECGEGENICFTENILLPILGHDKKSIILLCASVLVETKV